MDISIATPLKQSQSADMEPDRHFAEVKVKSQCRTVQKISTSMNVLSKYGSVPDLEPEGSVVDNDGNPAKSGTSSPFSCWSTILRCCRAVRKNRLLLR